MAEILSCRNIGNVDFNCGERHGFQRVKNCNACVRVGGGIYDYAVKLTVSRLNFVNYAALVVRLKQLNLHALFGGIAFNN